MLTAEDAAVAGYVLADGKWQEPDEGVNVGLIVALLAAAVVLAAVVGVMIKRERAGNPMFDPLRAEVAAPAGAKA